MTIIIGLIVIILLIISLLPNYKAMVLAKQQGQKPTRYTIMVGIDLIDSKKVWDIMIYVPDFFSKCAR
ncbi:MAG: hypothetical protein E6755_05805 [Staphylococcus epidermidis]|nr:hypothetical protein [Staphylococcus epidermidis]